MRRISFESKDLSTFPHDIDSGYVKLLLDHEGELVRRTYTVRTFNPATLTLDIDFVLHGDEGPASAWASTAKPGSTLGIMGPGPKKLVDFSADWFLMAGDITALPALSVNIEQLPADARGYLAIEIPTEEDKQSLPFPEAFEVHWVINPKASKEHFPLLEKIKEFKFLAGTPSMWVAGEFHSTRAIRRYLKQERGVQRGELYASSYWHIGLTEDRHKVKKAESQD
jgi:NADPH-dependent ferric siderophore reductase